MRGVGGPLLCIGDLLSDVGEAEHQEEEDQHHIQIHPSTPPSAHISLDFQPSRLNHLFQENYDQLDKALAGTDHSWTSLTLKLCTALDTAKMLIESANSNALVVLEKVGQLEKIIKKGDSAMAEVRFIHSSLGQRNIQSSEREA